MVMVYAMGTSHSQDNLVPQVSLDFLCARHFTVTAPALALSRTIFTNAKRLLQALYWMPLQRPAYAFSQV